MLSSIHQKLGTAGFIISIVALVAALGGGAYAASGGLNGKQKKEVEKIAKKYAGKSGQNGANGAPGEKGAAGAPGQQGSQGPEGSRGAEGPQGQQGTQGKEGNPWAAGGTLPSGESEYGAFAISFIEEQFSGWTSISFPIQLSSQPTMNYRTAGEAANAACPGTFAHPRAAAGNLCMYEAVGGSQATLASFENPELGTEPGGESVGKSGVNLFFSGEPFGSARGVWVVTAPE